MAGEDVGGGVWPRSVSLLVITAPRSNEYHRTLGGVSGGIIANTMAEALTLLGLVANVLQFVEVGRALLSAAKEAHEDAKGLTKDLQYVHLLLEDIKSTRHLVETHQSIDSPLPMSTDEVAIWNYSKECDAIAASLDQVLDKLRVRNDAMSRKVESFRVAVVGIAKRSEVQKLVDRLEQLDERLRRRLRQVLDKEAVNRAAGLHDELLNTTISGFSSVLEVMEKLDSKNESLEIQSGQTFDTLRLELLKEIRLNKTTLSQTVVELADNARRTDEYQKLLESLLYTEIKQRYSDIEEAHTRTFKWMFRDDGSTNFPLWLESASDLFWVTGLAGSGKSTLMKYIFENRDTRLRVLRWAGKKKLIMGSFYFWNQGTRMQKSLQGLMQSLLFQIARSDAQLARTLCQHRSHEPEPWSLQELREVFRRFSEMETNYTFCFFIDGLDEYDGEEEDVIMFIKTLAASPSIKMCVSSRPWNQFRQAFGASNYNLILEDLTRMDIMKYVESELAQNEALQRSVALDPRCRSIAEQVAERAQGVFLWVYLVVRSLKRDLQSEESFEHLQRRIDELPPTLSQWFQKIFERIDPIYRMETARLLLVTLFLEDNDLAPLPLLAYHCLEAEVHNPSYAVESVHVDAAPTALSDLPNAQRIAAMRLNDRCRDLMQPRTDRNYKVDTVHRVHLGFLHRTVRDFLREHNVDILIAKAGDYSPARSLARVHLSLYKRYPIDLFWSRDESAAGPEARTALGSLRLVARGDGTNKAATRLPRVLAQFWNLAHAHEAEVEDSVVDGFDAVVTARFGAHWAGLLVRPSLAQSLRLGEECKMLAWAAYLGLASYLRRQWDRTTSVRKFDGYGVAPLALALEQKEIMELSISGPPPALVPAAILVLLEGGCSPNAGDVGYGFLRNLLTLSRKEIDNRFGSMEDVYQVTKLLFRHGLRIPSIGLDLYQANFASELEPLFGAARVNELWALHEHVQQELGWKARLSRKLGWL